MFSVLFFHRFIIQTFGAPETLKYLLDLLNVILFLFAVLKQRIENAKFLFFYVFTNLILIITGLISFFLFGKLWDTPLMNLVFDLRGVIRFPVFLISCYITLEKKQTENLFGFFIAFHLLNCVYIIYQYFTLEVEAFWMRGDNLNGFFGTETGGNQFVNVLMIVTTVIVIDKFIKKEYSKVFAIGFILLNLIIAVLIELKFYFVEFAFIALYFVSPYLKKISSKRILIGLVMLMLMPFVYCLLVQMLYKIYPWMEGTMSITGMLHTNISEKGYTGSGDFNRFNSISGTITKIFKGNIAYSMIGVGLGTANLNGEFAKIYEYTHYSWMSTSYMFIETGFIGFICYAITLLMPWMFCHKNSIYLNSSRIGAFLLVALMIYDEALRTEAGYMIFFLVSTGLISKYDCMEEYNKCQRLIKTQYFYQ